MPILQPEDRTKLTSRLAVIEATFAEIDTAQDGVAAEDLASPTYRALDRAKELVAQAYEHLNGALLRDDEKRPATRAPRTPTP